MIKPLIHSATVRELRNNFAKISTWLEEGHDVRITRRGKPFARVVAERTASARKRKRPNAEARAKRMHQLFGDTVFKDNIVITMRNETNW